MHQDDLRDAIEALNLKRLIAAAGALDCSAADPYLPAYPHLRHHFAQSDLSTPHGFVIAAHIVYAWMPRVLTLHPKVAGTDLITPAAKVLATAKTAPETVTENDYDTLAAPFNGSFVAPSKLLHFANHSYFAIWDSRVVKGIMRLAGEPVAGQVGHHVMCKREHLVNYQERLRELAKEAESKGLPPALDRLEAPASTVRMTTLRSLEYVLFSTGGAAL